MSKRKFINNHEAVECGERRQTKKELKDRLKRYQTELKQYNKHMNSLSDIYDEYGYNREKLNEIIGTTYIKIEQKQNDIQKVKRDLKNFKK